MVRRVAFGLLVLAACVGDDPGTASPPDASTTTPDASTSTTDSGGETDSESSTNDTGSDATAPCVKKVNGLVSWWTGDDAFTDHEVNNPLTPNTTAGGAVSFVPGRVGNAFSFDGNAFLERTSPVSLDNLTGLTIEGWIEAGANADNRIADRSTVGTPDGWLFDVYMTRLRLLVGTASIDSKGQLPLDTLKHVAGTFDGVTLRLYIDGFEDNALTLDASQTIPTAAQALRIGGASNGAARWKGKIDELAIYSRALLPVEIKAIFDAGANGRCK